MITRLRLLRLLRDMTLREVAKETGIVAQRIWKHEKRRERLFPRDRERYGRFFGVDGEGLIDGEGLAAWVEDTRA